jgi:hypothetical protein
VAQGPNAGDKPPIVNTLSPATDTPEKPSPMPVAFQASGGHVGAESFVFALDRDLGVKAWSTKVGRSGGDHPGTRCTPTVDGDRVYTLGQWGELVCLKAAEARHR